jgi:hypothetical protein
MAEVLTAKSHQTSGDLLAVDADLDVDLLENMFERRMRTQRTQNWRHGRTHSKQGW